MEKLLYLTSLMIYSFIIFFIWNKWGKKESMVSPLNLFLLFQSLIILFQFLGLLSDDLRQQLTAAYFRKYVKANQIDYLLMTINALSYAFLNILVALFLVVFRYRPLKLRYSSYLLNKAKRYSFLFLIIALVTILFTIKLYGKVPSLSPLDIMNFRYFLGHNEGVLLSKIITLALKISLASTIIANYKFKKSRLTFISTLSVFVVWATIQGSRGFFVWNLLFFVFLAFPTLTSSKLLQTLGKINKRTMLLAIVLLILVIYFQVYSTSIRGYEKTNILFLISQRLDCFLGSYLVLFEGLIGPSNESLIALSYPVLSFIPRKFFKSKPFPVSATITYKIFGFHESWSSEFGGIGEAYFVFPILWEVLQSLIIAGILKFISQFSQNVDIISLIVLSLLYTYPLSIYAAGISTPSTGDLLYITLPIWIIGKTIFGRYKL